MAPYEPIRKRGRGSIDVAPSGSLRVRVFAGYDSVSKKRHYLTEHISPGPDAEKEAEKVRTRLVNQVNERRHPRTKATVPQLMRSILKMPVSTQALCVATSGTSKITSSH